MFYNQADVFKQMSSSRCLQADASAASVVGPAAVAVASPAAASSGPADKDARCSAEAGALKLSYSKDESESLHPFWACADSRPTSCRQREINLPRRWNNLGWNSNYHLSIARLWPRRSTLCISQQWVNRIWPAQDLSMSRTSPMWKTWTRAMSWSSAMFHAPNKRYLKREVGKQLLEMRQEKAKQIDDRSRGVRRPQSRQEKVVDRSLVVGVWLPGVLVLELKQIIRLVVGVWLPGASFWTCGGPRPQSTTKCSCSRMFTYVHTARMQTCMRLFLCICI